MTRETIKEYILQVKSQDGTEALYNKWEPDILVEVIDQIFDDHEAQLKAKDEEIKELGEIVQQYLIPSKNYDAIIKAKDEEIVKLKLELFRSYPKIANKKTRSIVAMLFWLMKRQKAIYVKSFNDLGISNRTTSFYRGAYESSKIRFKQAYKMLKDTKWH